MKKMVFFLIFLIFIVGCVSFKQEASYCESKTDLSEEEIASFEEISNEYLGYIAEGDYIELDKHLSSLFKETNSLEDIEMGIEDFKISQELGDFERWDFIDVFKIKSTPDHLAFCGTSISDKKKSFFVYTTKGVSSYVLVTQEVSTSSNVTLYFFNELIEEDNEWKLLALSFQLKELSGKSSDYFIGIADEQFQKGNKRNAVIFYSVGSKLLINNYLLRTAYVDEIRDKTDSIGYEDIPQEEPLEWTSESGKTFVVYQMMPQLLQKEIALQVNFVTSDLSDQEQVDSEAKELAIYINKNFQEYQEVFDGLIIKAVERIPEPGEVVDAYNNVYRFDELN